MRKSSRFKVISTAFIFCVVTAISLSAQTFETYNLDGTDGSDPNAALVQGTDGNLYGVTTVGGSSSPCNGSGCGTIFKITPAGKLTTLHNFDETDGAFPLGALVQGTDGNFYGTTELGGANADGTVFQITPAGKLTTLHSFDSTDGGYPSGALVQGTDGNFYSTTARGGSSSTCDGGRGPILKITPAGKQTALHSFCVQKDCPDGAAPQAGLVQGTDGD